MKPATPKTERPPSTQLRKAVFGGFLLLDDMKQNIRLVAAGVVMFSVMGCVSVTKQSAFRAAGSPADRRSTLIVGYELRGVKVDGEKISLLPPGFGTAAWRMEMLPGQHQIEAYWANYKLEGSFVAKSGEDYVFVTDVSTSPFGVTPSGQTIGDSTSSGQRIIGFATLNSAWIAKIPPDEKRGVSFGNRMVGATGDFERQKLYEKVGWLHSVSGGDPFIHPSGSSVSRP